MIVRRLAYRCSRRTLACALYSRTFLRRFSLASVAPIHAACFSATVPHAPMLHAVKRSFATAKAGSGSFSAREKEVFAALRDVRQPGSQEDVVFEGLVRSLSETNGAVSISLQLGPHYRDLKRQVMAVVSALPWVEGVRVNMFDPDAVNSSSTKDSAAQKNGLSGVKHIIAVSSCKGGVGKSTVAVNLAYSLEQMDFSVGLLDADIFGPSLPNLIHPEDKEVLDDPRTGLVRPILYKGVKTMSYGYVMEARNQTASIMRGPMASSVVHQLATFTNWGDLDYLVVDMPPGTGDIQITLSQQLKISGAVIVTTPHELSFVDVVKGIDMFQAVNVPIISVVENMSYFVCDGCDKKHYIFGQSCLPKLIGEYGIEKSFDVPIHTSISRGTSESGEATVLSARDCDQELVAMYGQIAAGVVDQLKLMEDGRIEPPTVEYVKEIGIVLTVSEHDKRVLDPAALRRACRCASCVEEFSGRRLLRDEDIKEDVHPTVMQQKGNYAVAVYWSDGHSSSIYPFARLLEMSHEALK